MHAIDRDEKIAWLRLARSAGIGPIHASKLVERFGTAVEAVAALPRLLATGNWGTAQLAGSDGVLRELEAAERQGTLLIVRGEPLFPQRLREIPDPPVALCVRGRIELLERPGVAVVGARNASANGRHIAQAMARELASEGVNVVSGLARGIDTGAHRGALEGGGATTAVVAGGADIVYPEENAALMATIAEAGVVLSERPLGAVPRARDFPRRNRLISGLAFGVVVIEAAPQSGSLITARIAAEQGREVMAVPGSPLDPRHRGTNRLLRDGAALVESAADVLELLDPLVSRLQRRNVAAIRPEPPARAPRARRPQPDASMPREHIVADCIQGGDLADDLRRHLGPDPLAVDELVRQCQASVAAIQAALLDLELEGRLERHPGNRVSLRPG
jgi:DNA processing protein